MPRRLFANTRHSESPSEHRIRREPLNETISGNWSSSVKREVATAMAAVGLVTGFGFTASCSESNSPSEIAKPEEAKVIKATAQTDASGTAVFNANGSQYTFTAMDSETGEAISGLYVIMALKGDQGIYIVLDPNNRYSSRIIGIHDQIKLESSSDSVSQTLVGEVNTRVVFRRTETLCDAGTNFVIQDKSPEELFNDTNFLTLAGFGEQPFRSYVPLSELSDTLRHLLEATVGELTQEGLTTSGAGMAVYLGQTGLANLIRTITERTLIPLLLNEICTIGQTLDWTRYYRSLCYADDAKFNIWKWGGREVVASNTDGGTFTFISNPIFVILPATAEPNSWSSPVANITGEVKIPNDDPRGFTNEKVDVIVRHVSADEQDRLLGALWKVTRVGDRNFSFTVSACENFDPQYFIYTYDDLSKYGVPLTSIRVRGGENYTIRFDLREGGCEGVSSTRDYSTYYKTTTDSTCGDKFNIVVACEKPDGYDSVFCDVPIINPESGITLTCRSIPNTLMLLNAITYGHYLVAETDDYDNPLAYMDINNTSVSYVPPVESLTLHRSIVGRDGTMQDMTIITEPDLYVFSSSSSHAMSGDYIVFHLPMKGTVSVSGEPIDYFWDYFHGADAIAIYKLGDTHSKFVDFGRLINVSGNIITYDPAHALGANHSGYGCGAGLAQGYKPCIGIYDISSDVTFEIPTPNDTIPEWRLNISNSPNMVVVTMPTGGSPNIIFANYFGTDWAQIGDIGNRVDYPSPARISDQVLGNSGLAFTTDKWASFRFDLGYYDFTSGTVARLTTHENVRGFSFWGNDKVVYTDFLLRLHLVDTSGGANVNLLGPYSTFGTTVSLGNYNITYSNYAELRICEASDSGN